jgi:hypothetical protein
VRDGIGGRIESFHGVRGGKKAGAFQNLTLVANKGLLARLRWLQS